MTGHAGIAELYRRELRELASKVRADKRLQSAELTVARTSRTCGSTVTLDIAQLNGVISDLGWRTRACTLGMAATAAVISHAPGKSFAECSRIGEDLRRLLAGEEVTFPAEWRDLSMFKAARALPERHGSILLPFDALEEAASVF